MSRILLSVLLVSATGLGCGGNSSGIGTRPRDDGGADAGGNGGDGGGVGSDGFPVGPDTGNPGGGDTGGDTAGGDGSGSGSGTGTGTGDGTGTGTEPERQMDTDGDWISDWDEGLCAVDTDADTIPDCRDLDSDADGIPDAVEGGDADLSTPPIDTDGDGIPDFRDFDSDGDGILDAVEGTADPDHDGKGNWIDLDSDGDGLPDAQEGQDDPDGDLLPNYLDPDSDNDTIGDWIEGFEDTDHDGIPDRFDLDSDNDGVPDSVEAGDADLQTNPVDTDGDGLPDFLDLDSDGDGLPDSAETGCPGASDRLLADSDSDGYSDLAEEAVGSDPCSASSTVYDYVQFFFVLPWDGPQQGDSLEFSTDLRQVDVSFNMDTTGSMGGEIGQLQQTIANTIIPDINTALSGSGSVTSVAFGVSDFRDFPVGGFGDTGDWPFTLRQRVTTSTTAAHDATLALSAGGGNDYPEAGWESLYQVATGAGGVSWSGGSIPGFNPAVGRIVGVADGTIGGVGFRAGSFPIVVHLTDAPSHEASDYGSYVTGEHSGTQAINALNAISARVIGVASGSDAKTQLLSIATQTNAVVPVCAFNNACGTNKCCTGINGAAENPVGSTCPLAFSINGDGSGLSTAVVDAIEFLATASTLEVTTRVVRDEAEFTSSGIDTSCFIKAVIPNHAVAPDLCAGEPQPADLYAPFGVDDSFENVTPGTQVFFDVFAQNDTCAPPTDQPQVFSATIQVLGDGVTVLDSLEVTVIVPPADLSGPKP